MNIFALKGHKVKCSTLEAGYDHDKEIAKKYLEVGKFYRVEKTEVDNFHTDVWLIGFPDIKFNSVFFEDIVPQDKELDKLHHNYKRFNRI